MPDSIKRRFVLIVTEKTVASRNHHLGNTNYRADNARLLCVRYRPTPHNTLRLRGYDGMTNLYFKHTIDNTSAQSSVISFTVSEMAFCSCW